ncbi:hypothetical protein GCM10022215_37990 [Nocardioides fonticola]|uniref:Uncharacterized protein n=1 Tax=Nocardioides fonticola TaxID=450363 RepID=A0ABP7XXM6_9ACTN
MNQPTNTTPADGSPQHPLNKLRGQLTQAFDTAGRLRAILATGQCSARSMGMPR